MLIRLKAKRNESMELDERKVRILKAIVSNSNTNDMDSFIVSFSRIYVDYRQKKTDSTRRISDELY